MLSLVAFLLLIAVGGRLFLPRFNRIASANTSTKGLPLAFLWSNT